MTQREIIYNVLRRNGDWTPSYALIKIDTQYGWLGTSADRMARQMVEDGEIERQQRGKYAYYRIKGAAPVKETWQAKRKAEKREALEAKMEKLL